LIAIVRIACSYQLLDLKVARRLALPFLALVVRALGAPFFCIFNSLSPSHAIHINKSAACHTGSTSRRPYRQGRAVTRHVSARRHCFRSGRRQKMTRRRRRRPRSQWLSTYASAAVTAGPLVEHDQFDSTGAMRSTMRRTPWQTRQIHPVPRNSSVASFISPICK
jgi:hypothetical protein